MAFGLSTPKTELATVINCVDDEMQKLLPLKRMPAKQRKLFSTDLALIGLAIRTGYLVDTVAPQHTEVFPELLSRLRLICPMFKLVMHVYEPTSDQSFFVHLPLLLENGFLDILGSSSSTGHSKSRSRDKTIFVRLMRGGPEVSTALPSGLTIAARSLLTTRSHIPTSMTLPTDLTPETTIPLAALLLEYPVAYVPPPEQLVFLSNVPLNVYECILVFGNDQNTSPDNHLLLKFSCPSNLAEQHPDTLSSSHIIAYLKETFKGRLQESVPGATFRITQNRETRDRVAL